MIRILTLGTLALAAVVLADDSDQRAKLTGSWQTEANDTKEAWVLQPSHDGMHITVPVAARRLWRSTANWRRNAISRIRAITLKS